MADKSKEATYRYPRLKGIDDNDSWLDPAFLEAEALYQLPPTGSIGIPALRIAANIDLADDLTDDLHL